MPVVQNVPATASTLRGRAGFVRHVHSLCSGYRGVKLGKDLSVRLLELGGNRGMYLRDRARRELILELGHEPNVGLCSNIVQMPMSEIAHLPHARTSDRPAPHIPMA